MEMCVSVPHVLLTVENVSQIRQAPWHLAQDSCAIPEKDAPTLKSHGQVLTLPSSEVLG